MADLRLAGAMLVGSEELIPGDGWAYESIAPALVARPEMSGAELAATIVEAYGIAAE